MLKHADGQRNVFRIGSFNFGVRKAAAVAASSES